MDREEIRHLQYNLSSEPTNFSSPSEVALDRIVILMAEIAVQLIDMNDYLSQLTEMQIKESEEVKS
jgi:hypothetical protein